MRQKRCVRRGMHCYEKSCNVIQKSYYSFFATYATTQPTYARNLHFPKKMISLSHSNPLRIKKENKFLEEKDDEERVKSKKRN